MRRDYKSTVYELKQIAECLGLSSASYYVNEIKDINEEIAKLMKNGGGSIKMEFILAHIIMRAKDRGPQK